MANIVGLHGFNPSSGTSRLFAAYGNDIVNVAAATGYGLNLNGNNVEFASFLDQVFMQNNSARPKSYNTSTNTWTTQHNPRTPRSKYIASYKNRLYLGNCQFTPPDIPLDKSGNQLAFSSKVFYSDLYDGVNLTWGLEWGTNGQTNLPLGGGAQNLFAVRPNGDQLYYQDFKGQNVKVGDPLFLSQNAPGGYTNKYFIEN